MLTIQIRARTGSDGILHIDVPTGLAETEVEGCLVMNALSPGKTDQQAGGDTWPEGYFEATAGQLKGELIRGDQGEMDRRNWPE